MQRCSASEWDELMDLVASDVFGEARADLRQAVAVTTIGNLLISLWAKKGTRKMEVEGNLLSALLKSDEEPEEMTAEEQLEAAEAALSALRSQVDGTILRHK